MTGSDTSDLREGELSNGTEVRTDASVQFIGAIRTPYITRDMCPRQGALDGPDCRVELLPEWEPALDGITRFVHLDILYWLHESRRDLVVQNPKKDGKLFGTFALRSPVRPNPIGLSRVRLIRRDGPILIVKGLDCIDKTPLVDIKPNRCEFTPEAPPKAADRP